MNRRETPMQAYSRCGVSESEPQNASYLATIVPPAPKQQTRRVGECPMLKTLKQRLTAGCCMLRHPSFGLAQIAEENNQTTKHRDEQKSAYKKLSSSCASEQWILSYALCLQCKMQSAVCHPVCDPLQRQQRVQHVSGYAVLVENGA